MIYTQGTNWVSYLPAIISSLGTILAAWFAYNQYSKNKETDAKIESWKEAEKKKGEERSENAAKIYGELWRVLHGLGADRVYILQPHPLSHCLYLTIVFEVKRNGISSVRSSVQRLDMGSVPVFSAELAKRDFLMYGDISAELKDDQARGMMQGNGVASLYAKRLKDEAHGWTGSILCEFCNAGDLAPANARALLAEAAVTIQYILPEVRDLQPRG